MFAVLSDIHSNLPALKAVLEHMEGEYGRMHIVIAGDMVGYGPYPNETLELLRKQDIYAIRGNHDRVVSGLGDGAHFRKKALETDMWTRKVISEENRNFLKGLPRALVLYIGGHGIGVFHGSPAEEDRYIKPGDASEEILDDAMEYGTIDILILGHTHLPFTKRLKNGMVMNPGSVGQPRDGDPRASYAVVNPESETVEIHRVEYDIESIRARIKEIPEIDDFFADRLLNGK